MTKKRFDIKQHVTDAIIAQIEAGTPPWRKPWTGGGVGGGGMPLRHNGEAYRGINILMLWASAHVGGFTSNRWLTFKQAKNLGGMVKKGSVCTKSVYYGSFEKEDETNEREQGNVAQIRYAKFFNVFNADQIDGLPEAYYVRPDPPKDLGTQANPELDAFFAATGAEIVTSDDPRAYYHPSKDLIHMPPINTFHSAEGFYSTLGHESCHWVCGAPRLATQKANANREEYAFDELVAELGASFLAVQLGFAPDFGQSAAYLKNWLDALKADSGLIFKAAAEAQKAVDELNALVNAATTKEVAT